MTPTITAIRRLSRANDTSECKACGKRLQFVEPCYVVTIRVNSRTFTPRICIGCRTKREPEIIAGLIEQAKLTLNTEDIFITDYVKELGRESLY